MERKSEINEWEMNDQTVYLIDVDVENEEALLNAGKNRNLKLQDASSGEILRRYEFKQNIRTKIGVKWLLIGHLFVLVSQETRTLPRETLEPVPLFSP